MDLIFCWPCALYSTLNWIFDRYQYLVLTKPNTNCNRDKSVDPLWIFLKFIESSVYYCFPTILYFLRVIGQ